ncbi:hypothetical protein NC652_007985 [Populus alba x Populus x berolinensis]|nr:hypothetical protein NC652_007985 [Populus alba x Populus x berolinensis]
MSSITQEKTHKKRPYGSLRTPPIPAFPGFPKNPLHPILQYHPRESPFFCPGEDDVVTAGSDLITVGPPDATGDVDIT